MTKTARHHLPLIASEQAQKHVTHNEAMALVDALLHVRLLDIDRDDPPGSPVLGATYGIGATPSGAWDGHAGAIASWTVGGWRFSAPVDGMLAWDADRERAVMYRDGAWNGFFDAIDRMGIGGAADGINRLLVRSEAALFTAADSGDVRLTLNKDGASDSATLVFQSGYSGRAEIGLAGTDDFAFKVSEDGVAFVTAMTIAGDGGFVTFDAMAGNRVSYPTVSGGVLTVASGHVVPAPQTGTSDDVDTIAGGFDGALLIVTGTAGMALTFRDGVGNLKLGADRVLDNFEDALMLVRRGGDWIELSFADNG